MLPTSRDHICRPEVFVQQPRRRMRVQMGRFCPRVALGVGRLDLFLLLDESLGLVEREGLLQLLNEVLAVTQCFVADFLKRHKIKTKQSLKIK